MNLLRRAFCCREASPLCRALGHGLRASSAAGGRQRRLGSEKSSAGEAREVAVGEGMTVAELARALGTSPWKILKVVRSSGKRADGYTTALPIEVSELVAMKMGHTVASAKSSEVSCPPRDPQALRPRPPVVTVMGHVDHGKTTLLDYLRKTSVALREAGGITQHIGAFSVPLSTGDQLTFLDTPGHAAFSAMRTRGASVTDIVVLVVAADDGVKVQTKECIELVKAAGVPLVVAINKCDKHRVDVSRVKRDLLQCGVQLEEFGGDVQAVEISALKGTGVLQLEEALLVQAELSAVRGDPGGMVEGVVLEAHLDRGLGAVASVIVQHGTLRCGDVLVAGNGWCKVRKMLNELGEPVRAAPPSAPVLTVGWSEMPVAGEKCLQVESRRIARSVVQCRATTAGQSSAVQRSTVLGGGEVKSVPVLVKGDVVGSVEALVGVLEQNQPQGLSLNVLLSGVGAVSESDVEMAASTNSVILAYGVSSTKALSAMAKQKGVTVLSHKVIYKLLEQLKAHLESLLPWVEEEEVVGEAVVLKVFKLTGAKAADVGGCRVKVGRLVRGATYRLVRDGVVIHEGQLSAMKHGKEDIDVARKETECGLSFSTNPDWKEGDRVIAFTTHKTPPKLTWNMGF